MQHSAIEYLESHRITPGSMGMLLASTENGFFHGTSYKFDRALEEFIDPIMRAESKLYELCQPIYITALHLHLKWEDRFFCEACQLTLNYYNTKVDGYRLYPHHEEPIAVKLAEGLFKAYLEAFRKHNYWGNTDLPGIGDFFPHDKMVASWRQNASNSIKINVETIKGRFRSTVIRP